MSKYDTGLEAIPEPITEILDGSGNVNADVDCPDRRSAEQRLVEAGVLHSRVGFSTVGQAAWKAHRREVSDTPLFEYLLVDCARAYLTFYRDEFGYETDDAFLTAYDNDALLQCPSHVAATWQWITDLGPPTSPRDVRRNSLFWEDDRSSRAGHQEKSPNPEQTRQGELTRF